MSCELMIELMQRYVDDNLAMEEEMELDAHVSTCDQCASTFERLKLLSAELEQLPKVKPRYSVVDSILPKLAEIDRQQQIEREESAALVNGDSVIEPYNKTRTRRFFTNISWKVTGSVAIAACAALFFIWNNQTPSFNPEIASQPVPPQESAKKMDNGKMDHAESTEGLSKQDTATQDYSAPMADKSIQPNTIEESKELPPIPRTKKPEVSALHKDPGTASGNVNSEEASPTAQDSSATEDQPDSTGSFDGEELAVPEESDPEAFMNEQDMNHNALGQKMTYSLSDHNHLIDRDLKIANDDYVAEVKDRKLTISTAATNELVFSSIRQWTDAESISSIVWMENNRLYYEVVDNQRVRGYLIDVALKTEMLIK